jgi:hypothetical protein
MAGFKGKLELLLGTGAVLLVLAVAGAAWLWPRAVASYHYRAARKAMAESRFEHGLTLKEFEPFKAHLLHLREALDSQRNQYGYALLELCATRAIPGPKGPMAPDADIPFGCQWAELPGQILAVLWDFPPPTEVDRMIFGLAAGDPERGLLLARHRDELHQYRKNDGTSFILDGNFASSAGEFFQACSLKQGKPLFLCLYERFGLHFRNGGKEFVTPGRPRKLGEAVQCFSDRFPEDDEMQAVVLDTAILQFGPSLGTQPREQAIAFFAHVFKTAAPEHCKHALGQLLTHARSRPSRDPRDWKINLTQEELGKLDLAVLEQRFPGQTWYRYDLKALRASEGVQRD